MECTEELGHPMIQEEDSLSICFLYMEIVEVIFRNQHLTFEKTHLIG